MTPAVTRRPTWVVKLGGSLWNGDALRPWLAALAAERTEAGRTCRIVIVPGGGPFADAVRHAQPVLGYGAAAAHRMAILGMEQYGLALLDLEPGLAPARTVADMTEASGPVVWLPTPLAAEADVAESWDVTSDTLAAWLAGRLEAERLVLVKSAPLPAGSADARALARAGVIDPVLPDLMASLPAEVRCVGCADLPRFIAALRGGRPAGTRLTADAPMQQGRRMEPEAAWPGTSFS
ncbi:aspartate/glutamate/uridylate kinase [Azospirillum sp. TSO35-2]|uniref:amino acid kinase family protein n=1 Tax=Azospirillum sp. TSO35-2 TaxID=716796 RepID=UPI000D614032|nr:aspartate/glutamate/uridylate kinase [Azospirillum sp. TSO35-2]PWC37868.1 hypothetical protein TSO352_10500 [Azospirillum sp. TSO35-2]